MDSPRSDTNNQIIISGVSSHEDTPEQGSPSMEQGESSESTVPAAAADPDPALQPFQLAMVDHDREYGCRYCLKKFSNKQALGGHQNAHKVERAMEKNMQETDLGYYDGPNPYPPRISLPGAPLLGPYHRHHPDFLHRSLFSWSGGAGGGGGVVAYQPRPGADPYTPCLWSASAPPAPRFASPFPARPHFTLPGQNINVRLPNFGPGSSSAFRPVCNHQGPPGFSGFVIRPGGTNRPINLRNVPGKQRDESGLDLSLKLG